MFQNKVTCSNCNERIDALEVDCPFCQTHNFEYDKLHLSTSAVNTKWYFQLIFFLVGWMGVQLVAGIIEVIILVISRVPADQFLERMDLLAVTEFITYGLEFIAMVILIFLSKSQKKIVRPFIHLFEGEKTYIAGILGFVVLFIVSYGYEYFRSFFNESISTNQEMVELMINAYPILALIFFGILGPVCEELTYRVGLFGLLRRWNRLAAYLISIFLFAFVHFDITSLLNILLYKDPSLFINELWNFPSYLIGGASLVILYDLFGFGASSIAHILNNVVSIGQIMVVHYVIK